MAIDYCFGGGPHSGHTLADGEVVEISGYDDTRKYANFRNVGETSIYMAFGDQDAAVESGIVLWPGEQREMTRISLTPARITVVSKHADPAVSGELLVHFGK